MKLADLVLTQRQRDRLERTTAVYEGQLDGAALAYLHARGLDDRAIASARLGCVRNALPGDEQFVNRISIPYLTKSGVVALKYRAIGDSDLKYHAPAGQVQRLFNVAALADNDGDEVAICEGEFDALVLHHMVGVPAVGVPGVSSWKGHHARCFADFSTVYVVTDNDAKEDGSNPGQELAGRVLKDLRQAVLVTPPVGLDVNEWFLRDGANAVKETLVRTRNGTVL